MIKKYMGLSLILCATSIICVAHDINIDSAAPTFHAIANHDFGHSRMYVSNEIAINEQQCWISFLERIKARTAWLGTGRIVLNYATALLCAAELMATLNDCYNNRLTQSKGFLGLALLLNIPRGWQAFLYYFINREIGFLRDQIERLAAESTYGIVIKR